MIPGTIDEYYKLHARFYDATRWGFLFGRKRLVDLLPDLPGGSNIFDLGCGTGLQLQNLRLRYPKSSLTGIDQSPAMLAIANKKLGSEISLVEDSFPSKSINSADFDLVTASYSLTMVHELDEVLDSVINILKPGAFVAVVDFDQPGNTIFDRWMKKNHVHFDYHLFDQIKDRFSTVKFETRTAYFGLYTYSLFLGKKKPN